MFKKSRFKKRKKNEKSKQKNRVLKCIHKTKYIHTHIKLNLSMYNEIREKNKSEKFQTLKNFHLKKKRKFQKEKSCSEIHTSRVAGIDR